MSFSDLKNKTFFISGATRGIGRGIALSLAKEGAKLVVNYRSEESFEDLKNEVKKFSTDINGISLDLSDLDDIKTKLSAFAKEQGALHGIVNNAGMSKDQLALRIRPSDLEQTMKVNLMSHIMLTSTLTRCLMKSEEGASVVNISSVVGLCGNPGQVSYSASKAGLVGFTKSFAKEMCSKKIRCNAICPGYIETDLTKVLDEKVKETYLSTIPLNRFGNVEEVANLTKFLLSDLSAYMTGEIIKLDGGLYI